MPKNIIPQDLEKQITEHTVPDFQASLEIAKSKHGRKLDLDIDKSEPMNGSNEREKESCENIESMFIVKSSLNKRFH